MKRKVKGDMAISSSNHESGFRWEIFICGKTHRVCSNGQYPNFKAAMKAMKRAARYLDIELPK